MVGVFAVISETMPRSLRIQFPGAIYHLMNRGDRREPLFRDDPDRRSFLTTLGESCDKTGWQLHAWCNSEVHLQKEKKRTKQQADGIRWIKLFPTVPRLRKAFSPDSLGWLL